MDALESQPLWEATVTCQVRQASNDLYMLCLEGVSSEALDDLLKLQAVCSIAGD